jgi:hypothetical protein
MNGIFPAFRQSMTVRMDTLIFSATLLSVKSWEPIGLAALVFIAAINATKLSLKLRSRISLLPSFARAASFGGRERQALALANITNSSFRDFLDAF